MSVRSHRRWLGLAAAVTVAGCSTVVTHDLRVVSVAGPVFGIKQLPHASDVVRIAPADEHVLCYADCPARRSATEGDVLWIYFVDPVPLDLSPKNGLSDGSGENGKELMRSTIAHTNFNFDSARLIGDLSGLEAFLSRAQERPDARIVIEGHTDSVGSESYNKSLSNLRAIAVSRWLTQRGIDRSRIEIIALGESHPIASNATPDGRAKNRRAEAVLKVVVASLPATISETSGVNPHE